MKHSHWLCRCFAAVLFLVLPCSAADLNLLGDDDDDEPGLLDGLSEFAGLKGDARRTAIQEMIKRIETDKTEVTDIPDLVSVLDTDTDSNETRQTVCAALAAAGGPEVIAAGARLLRSPSEQDRKSLLGIQLLGNLMSTENTAAEALLAFYRTRPSERCQRAVLCVFSRNNFRRAVPELKRHARQETAQDHKRMIILTLVILGEDSLLEQMVQDYEDMLSNYAQIMQTWGYTMSKGDRQDKMAAWRARRLGEEYVSLFRDFLEVVSADQVKALAELLRERPTLLISAEIHKSLPELVTPETLANYLALLHVPVPEIQEWLARRALQIGTATQRQQTRSWLGGLRAAANAQDRALAMRMADLLPPADGLATLRQGLASQDYYVLTAALNAAVRHNWQGLHTEIQALTDQRNPWHDDGRVARLCRSYLDKQLERTQEDN